MSMFVVNLMVNLTQSQWVFLTPAGKFMQGICENVT